MRHYNKLKRELREIYQQPRPHRWDAVASRIRTRATLLALLDALAQVPKKLAKALGDLAEAVNKMLGTDPNKPGIITIHPARAIGKSAFNNATLPRLAEMHGLTIHGNPPAPIPPVFRRPDRQTSAHYTIDQHGITENVSPDHRAWHTGYQPHQPKHNIITGDISE